MTTSNSVDFQYTRTQLIERALRICGALREGISANSNQLTTGSLALNGQLKSFQAMGMPLWAIKEGAILPVSDTNTVTLGPSGGHAATTWVHTQVATAAATAATTLVVDSITGISASDQIGIELDDGTIQWTTVSGAPAGSTITLATGLNDTVAIDNHVYTYTTKIVRPLKIIHAQNFNYNGSTEIPINIISRDEYQRISNKTTESASINQIYYDPQLTRGIFNFYPRFLNGDSILKIWFQRPFEDMDAAGDNLDFPQEWEEIVVWNLADALTFENGVPVRKAKMIQDKALYLKMKAEEFGMEEGSIYITPQRR